MLTAWPQTGEAARGPALSKPPPHLGRSVATFFFFRSSGKIQQYTRAKMPAKELSRPCMDCKDEEAVLTVRKRQLCRSARPQPGFPLGC